MQENVQHRHSSKKLLVAPGITTRNKKLLGARALLLVAIQTFSKRVYVWKVFQAKEESEEAPEEAAEAAEADEPKLQN